MGLGEDPNLFKSYILLPFINISRVANYYIDIVT